MAQEFLCYMYLCWYNIIDFTRFSKQSTKLKTLKVIGKAIKIIILWKGKLFCFTLHGNSVNWLSIVVERLTQILKTASQCSNPISATY